MSLWSRLRILKNRLVLGAVVVSLPLVKPLSALFPKVCNNFAFMVVKPSVPGDLFPWLTVSGGSIAVNEAWLTERYKKA